MAQQYTSKLGAKYPTEYIHKMDKESHAEVKRIRSLPENRVCAECQAAPTTWASVSLGVFVCMRCSQVHRNLGTHLSKVKSCMGTYLWCPDELERMRSVGNGRAAALYAHSRTAGLPKPAEDCHFDEVDAFARAKYEAKRWLHPGGMAAVIAEEAARPAAPVAVAALAPSRAGGRQSAAARQTAANNRAAARAKARALRAGKGAASGGGGGVDADWNQAWGENEWSPRRRAGQQSDGLALARTQSAEERERRRAADAVVTAALSETAALSSELVAVKRDIRQTAAASSSNSSSNSNLIDLFAPQPMAAASAAAAWDDLFGKPAVQPPLLAPTTVCPNSMNGSHCYKSRANVFTCAQCGAKRPKKTLPQQQQQQRQCSPPQQQQRRCDGYTAPPGTDLLALFA